MAARRSSLRQTMAEGLAAILSLVAPERAERYLAAHARLSASRGYAAGRRDGANARWLPWDGKADALNSRDARLIRARSRALVRDNPNMGGALRKIVGNVVFTGIRPQAQLRGPDGHKNTAANDAVEAQWKSWASATKLWGQQKLAVRHCWLDGGFLVHFYPDDSFLSEGLVPLGVELLDLDALDTGVNGLQPNGNTALYGREYDRFGHVRAVHVWRELLFGGVSEPGISRYRDSLTGIGSGESVRLPSEMCRLVMEQDRIGQTLPVSWLHACLMTMHDFDAYQEAERIAARLAAAFAVFLKRTGPDASMGNGLDGAALTGGKTTAGQMLSIDKFVSSGRIDMLPPGTEIEIAENKRPGTNYEAYTRASLRGASSAVGTSYETFSNDFTGASYSSVRQAILEERRGYRMQQHFLAEEQLQPVWRMFTLWRRVFGLGTEKSVPEAWQFPGWQWVDPTKDSQAARDRVELGVMSRREICAEQGRDFDEVLEQLAEEEQLMRERGLPTRPASGSGRKADSEDGDVDDNRAMAGQRRLQ